MIIVEGIDGSGKTFLTEVISIAFEIPIIKFDGPPKTPTEFYRRCTKSINGLFEPCVHDRFPLISDIIYSRLENRKPYISKETLKNIIIHSNALVIHCRTDSISNHHVEKYDKIEYIKKLKQNWKLIQKEYRNLMSDIGAITYNIFPLNKDINLIIDSVSFLLRKQPSLLE